MVLACRRSDPKEEGQNNIFLMRAKARLFPLGMGARQLVAGIIQIQTLSRGRRFPVQLHLAVLLGAVQLIWMPCVHVQWMDRSILKC